MTENDLLPHEQHVWLTAFAVALENRVTHDVSRGLRIDSAARHAIARANLAVRKLREYMRGDADEAPAFLYDIYKVKGDG